MKKDQYSQGYNDAVITLYGSRTIESHAKFLLPYLKPGLDVLDCGCGPGSITVGLANKVAPGKVIGIEVDEGQLEMARELAAKKVISNAVFEKASVYELPYSMASFDLVYVSAVLGNLKEPEKALLEIYRVLKPGGLVALREFDGKGNVFYPDNENLQRSIELWTKLRRSWEQEPYGCGRLLKKMVKESNFRNPKFSGSYEVFADKQSVALFAKMIINELEEDWGKPLKELELTTGVEVSHLIEAWKQFRENPDAIVNFAWFEVLAWKSNES